MSVFSIGEVLRKHRVELGISQEDLCTGICSVPTLSRIENGVRVPSKSHFDALMQRMGQSGEMYDAYIGTQDFEIHETKFKIRSAIIACNYELASELLIKLKKLNNENDNNDNISKQFIMYIEVILKAKGVYDKYSLKVLEDAIRLTMPSYGKTKIYERLLTFDEITILNNIGNAYGLIGKTKKSIKTLYELKKFMDKKYINSEEKVRTYPMVLYNLSKWLGLDNRFEECIEICDIGIVIAAESSKMQLLSKLLYNKAWCMMKMQDLTLQEDCRKLLLQAYYIATATGQNSTALTIKKFGLENCLFLKEEYFY
ncbi:helix-turn-helix transcriptional regulator [Sedimentibacter sp. zth1]|uniref:helix-turn-helix domain-containing protein n=1 Tax=Sedimentibacter sp. zth1 TaxID=2816908 RepID=UPI001A939550|nr:helix-turn-helix domain-containing protein [Sedimentibacter sp. zth1]QSX05326.1 helix-turn-helix transcriptional regulator [Sedimentibacter sp. zth1]